MGNAAPLPGADCAHSTQVAFCPPELQEGQAAPRPQGMSPAPYRRQGDMHSMSASMASATAPEGSPFTTIKQGDDVNPTASTVDSAFDTRRSSSPHGHPASGGVYAGAGNTWASAASSIFGSSSLDPYLAVKPPGRSHGAVASSAARMGSALFAGSMRFSDPMQSAPTFSAVGVPGPPPPPTWGGVPMIPVKGPHVENPGNHCCSCCW